MSNCRACDARIRWAKTERGKRIPLDEKPETRAVVVDPEKPGTDLVVRIRRVFVPHWATCPSSNQFRKGGEG